MNFPKFEPEEAARAQRMTQEETRAVIQRWQQEEIEQGGLTDKPTLADIAEGLNITLPDAQRLLDEVRAERQAQERLLAQEQITAEVEYARLAEEQRRLDEIRRRRAQLQQEYAAVQRRREPWPDAPLFPEAPAAPPLPTPDIAESAVALPSHQEFLAKLETMTQKLTPQQEHSVPLRTSKAREIWIALVLLAVVAGPLIAIVLLTRP